MRWQLPLFAVLVQGPSMAPTLRDGDALLVRRGGRAPARRRRGRAVPVPARTCWWSSARSAQQDGGWWVRGRQRVRHRRLPGVRSGRCHRPGCAAVLAPAGSAKLTSGNRSTPVCGCIPGDPRIARRSALTRAEAGWHRRRPMPCGVPVSFFSFELDPALAADPVFDLHRRRQDGDRADRPAGQPRRPVPRLHAGRRPGLRGDRRATRRWPPTTPGPATPSPWSPTAPPCSASATSARKAAMPVMEGKAVLFKQFGGVDAVPICLDTQDADEIIAIVKALAPSFGGINLEDISAPRCFEIERRLDAALDIPVFHDDQHGTAIVVLAALRNAATLLGRRFADLRVVISGAGAAGVAITKMLIAAGVHGANVIVCDSRGILHAERGRPERRPRPSWPRSPTSRGRTGGIAGGADRRRRADRRLRRHDRRDRAGRHGAGRHHLRAGQPDARGAAARSRPGTRPSSPPAAATSPTRSTTCWRSRASSAARWTPGPPRSPRG